MARNSKPRPIVSPFSWGDADLLLLLWREMEVPDAPLPKIDEVAGVGDGEVKGLAAVGVASLLCEEGEELAAALPPVAHTYFPCRAGFGAWGSEGGARTTRPRC